MRSATITLLKNRTSAQMFIPDKYGAQGNKYRVDFYGKDGGWWCHYHPTLWKALLDWFKYVIIGY